MKYKHCKRSGVAFIFLGIITLGIYPIVVLTHVRREVNTLTADNGVKKQMPFFWAYVLGLVTYEIVPIVWLAHMAEKVQIAALERKVTSTRISKAFVVCWLLFGSYIIVGPFLVFCRFFKLLNLVEQAENKRLEEENKAVEVKVEMKEEINTNSLKEESKADSVEEKKIETPYPTLPSASEKTYSPKPVPSVASVRRPTNASTAKPRPWRVRINGEVKVFETREQAVAYAQKVSAERRALKAQSQKKE